MLNVARRWELAPAAPPEHFARFGDLPAFVAQILYNRGLTDRRQVDSFLDSDGAGSHDPFAMKGMQTAVTRVVQAIARDERIVVYGDFDADGITSTALVVQFLQSLGARVQPYIPHRVDEGYGLNADSVKRLVQDGTRLLITVDCGVSSVAEIAWAQSHGMDVIVTDHHHMPTEMPSALAILNPRQPDCRYPFKDLAGVGVAYKLAHGICMAFGRDERELAETLDLVALGTVADLAPLLGENRALVRRGLAQLSRPERPGLQEMMLRAGLQRVDAGTIAFALGPRLNAAGRMDSAMSSYHLLTTEDYSEARRLADELESVNRERQRVTVELHGVARRQVQERGTDERLLLVCGDEFAPGIVGLVAGRLAEEYYRPAVVVHRGEVTSRGSARSIPEFSIVSALDECRDLLVRYGGHAQAAGFTVANENLAELHRRLLAIAERELAGLTLVPTLQVDVEVPLSGSSWQTLQWLERLAPFGSGNPAPVLMSRQVRVWDKPRVVGRDHLRLRLAGPEGGAVLDAIGFRLGHLADEIGTHPYWDIAYCLESNQWGDYPPMLQANIKAMRVSP